MSAQIVDDVAHGTWPEGEGEGRPLAVVFAALANAERLSILRALRDHEDTHGDGASISRVAQMVGLTRFSASRHLRILDVAGVVSSDRRGKAAMHRLRPGALDDVEDWIFAVFPVE